MSPIGYLLQRSLGLPTVITVHGLDITFPFSLYQKIIPGLVDKCSAVVCISENTRKLCLDRGISASLCRVIHPGVEVPEKSFSRTRARKHFEERLGRSLEDVTLFLTVGRLVPRKGVAWLLREVLPHLTTRSDWVYIVAGTGPDEKQIRRTIEKKHLQGSIFLLGQVSDDTLNQCYFASDLFLMPNLPVREDVEGFGLVALEAAAHSCFVLASDLEGIRDAVKNGATGDLLSAGDASVWISCLRNKIGKGEELSALGEQARAVVRVENSWQETANQYLEVFRMVLQEDRRSMKKRIASKPGN
jgi:glycosyltransferase involved in cell wall biosynthesis